MRLARARSVGGFASGPLFALAALVPLLLLACPALAEDEKEAKKDFETTWFGLRGEVWYEPTIGAQANVGGNGQSFHLDAQDDLGVHTHTPRPNYLDFSPGPIALEMFADTRWVSVSAFWITPFEYHGRKVVTQTFTFFGQQFTASSPTKTDLAQSIAGLDVKVNLINSRFIRVSPVIAARVLAIDWSVEADFLGQTFKGSTEDAALPGSFGRWKLLPYPEVGAEVRAGYRDYVEADVKLTGLYLEYAGYRGTTALLEAGVTGYLPILNNVGMRIGYRYYYMFFRAPNEQREPFDFHLRIYGVTISAIVRF